MILPRILVLLAIVFWGWTFVATKVVLPYVTPVELLGLRFLLGLPVLLAILAAKKLRFNFTPRSRRTVLFGSAIITAHFLIQITGLKYTSATNTGWIISVTPLVIALLSFLVLRERISRYQVVAIGVATIGILCLVSRGDFSSLGWLSSIGDWLILATAHTWAIFTVATRNVSRQCHPLTVTVGVLLPSSVVVLGYMLFTSDWSKFLHLPADAIVALIFLGILGLAVGHWFWQEGVSKLGATRAGLFLYIMPVSTTALAVPYLEESFGLFTAVGGILVLGAVFLAERLTSQIAVTKDQG
ncbi:MAG: DMT family transporter [candidate division Zixibacteria bacterium]|nr:DMT family transporter [candidate division Zixibacteria bacterium]